MKITDIIRSVLDIIDTAEAPTEPAVAVAIKLEPQEQIADMQRLAGILELDDGEYANAPTEVVAPVTAAFPAGDDVHHSKNPADIRTNAPSMYPGYQARM
jgi:hypothetical protein